MGVISLPSAHYYCRWLKSGSVPARHPRELDRIRSCSSCLTKTSPEGVLICLIASLTESAWHSAKVTSVGYMLVMRREGWSCWWSRNNSQSDSVQSERGGWGATSPCQTSSCTTTLTPSPPPTPSVSPTSYLAKMGSSVTVSLALLLLRRKGREFFSRKEKNPPLRAETSLINTRKENPSTDF